MKETQKDEKGLVAPYPNFVNKRKEILVNSTVFSFDYLKKFSMKICEKINLEKEYYTTQEKNQIILNLQLAIKYDNTNEKIIQKYLIALKKFSNINSFNQNLEKYLYHISPEVYKLIQNIEKNNSSENKLKEIFKIFEDYDKTIYSRNNIILYFCCNKFNLEMTNSNYNINNNKELSLIDLYYTIFSKMKEKINEFLEKIKNSKLDINEKVNEFCGFMEHKEVNELLFINTVEDSISLILLICSFKFLKILNNLHSYIKSIKSIISKCLEFKNLENDYYILLYIIFEIKHIIKYEENPKYTNAILDYKENNQIINNNNDIDLNIYYYDKIPNEMKTKMNFEDKKAKFIYKYEFIPYLKLEYSNNNNYVYYSLKFIKKFNKIISKSETISSLLNYLYPGYKEINLFKSDFMEHLFDDAIDNCYFYPFFYRNVGAYTLNRNSQILFFVPNRSNINEDSLELSSNFSKYLISNLGSFIYIELHELLGHYIRGFLSKITEMDYKSPRSNISKRNESGECIEILLFGGRIKYFTLKQLIFILDIKNYELEFNQFRKKFINIQNYIPSKECKKLLSELDINFNYISLDDNQPTAALFGFNQSISVCESNDIIDVPFLDDCTENIYEINNIDNTKYLNPLNNISKLIKIINDKDKP